MAHIFIRPAKGEQAVCQNCGVTQSHSRKDKPCIGGPVKQPKDKDNAKFTTREK